MRPVHCKWCTTRFSCAKPRANAPRLEEYVRRFPQYRDQLAPLFEVHRALESDELLGALADQEVAGENVTLKSVTQGPDPGPRSPDTKFSVSSGTAAWAWSTRPGRSVLTGWSL